MQAEAFAKINLSLRVGGADAGRLHSLLSLVTSIDWPDTIVLGPADDDEFLVAGGDVPGGGTNLVLRALEAVRDAAAWRDPVAVQLVKRSPVAAGLGGGSADAAATLALAAVHYGLDADRRDLLAMGLGADVPFCLMGGSARMEGHGERLTALDLPADYHVAVIVPPFDLPTGDVFRRWDELGGPSGPGIDARHLPDSLRDFAPLVNDLNPAAMDLRPELGDWIMDLGRLWDRPAVMSGSGPALFGFFSTSDEAADASAAVSGARAARHCAPVDRGWEMIAEPEE